MWLNSFDYDEGIDVSGQVSEKAREEYSEKAKKAQIQLKKIQKDEKMAKWDNDKLFLILQRFLSDSYYESLIAEIVYFMQVGVPSREIIALLSLFYPDATFYVADSLGKKDKLNLLLSLPRSETIQFFDEKNIHPAISWWMREWIVLMESFVISPDSSILMMKKFSELISGQELANIEKNFTTFIIFFFQTRNIKIDDATARNYARFILKNLRDNLFKYLQSQSENIQELLSDATTDVNDFFGK